MHKESFIINRNTPYIFRPCWVIFRENFGIVVCVVFGGVNSGPGPQGVHASSTQYTVNSTFSLNYKVQP
jgi:hypothetical protein